MDDDGDAGVVPRQRTTAGETKSFLRIYLKIRFLSWPNRMMSATDGNLSSYSVYRKRCGRARIADDNAADHSCQIHWECKIVV